jgi:hypothetical protein
VAKEGMTAQQRALDSSSAEKGNLANRFDIVTQFINKNSVFKAPQISLANRVQLRGQIQGWRILWRWSFLLIIRK